MKAFRTLLAGAAVAVAAGGFAAPAAAQYYPGGGYGTGNVLVGAILDSILRGGAGGAGGYGGYAGYGGYGGNTYANERIAVDQCARAAEARLSGRYGNGGYNAPYGGYGYNAGLRVNQIERVERTRNGNFRVVGWAGDAGWRGNYGAYGSPNGGYYGNAPAPTFRFSCKFDRSSGRITDLDLDRQRNARYRY